MVWSCQRSSFFKISREFFKRTDWDVGDLWRRMMEDCWCRRISLSPVLFLFLNDDFQWSLFEFFDFLEIIYKGDRWSLRSFLECLTHVFITLLQNSWLERSRKITALGTRLWWTKVHWYIIPGKAREVEWGHLTAGLFCQYLKVLKTILKNICGIFKFLWKECFALLQCPWDEARSLLDRQVKMFNTSAED